MSMRASSRATIFGAIGVMMVGAGPVISIVVVTFVKREMALSPYPRWQLAAFTRMLPTWLGIVNLPLSEWHHWGGKAHTQVIGTDGIWRLDRICHLARLELYILKGSQGTHHDRGIKHVPQGMIVDKRCGFSNTIGPAARERWVDRAA